MRCQKIVWSFISGRFYSCHKNTCKSDLLSPASTMNCPCGLQKILFACCLSNISANKAEQNSLLELYTPDYYSRHSSACWSLLLTYELNLAVVFDMIEGGVDSRRLSMEHCKFAAIWLPSKRNDAF